MPGAKTNERPVARPNGHRGDFDGGHNNGTRAVLRHVRGSAYKVREVLNLIRGLSIADARAELRVCEREAADVVLGVLNSAVANATNNDGLDPEELYVSACFADEGPTLRRFRARARGRGSRIRKRTSHVTVIVSRLPEGELGAKTSAAREERARRVAGRRRNAATSTKTESSQDPDATEAIDASAEDESPEVTDEASDAVDEISDAAEEPDAGTEASDEKADEE